MSIEKLKVIPFATKADIEGNEMVYSNLVMPKTKTTQEVVFGASLINMYEFCFFGKEHSDDAFVFHALIKFNSTPQHIYLNKNEAEGMDRLSVMINTMKGKKVLVEELKKVLERKQNNGTIEFEETKCLKHCNEWLKKYGEADFDCDLLTIYPVLMSIRSDDYGPVKRFKSTDKTKMAYRDEEREKEIDKTRNTFNVALRNGYEIELDKQVTMVWDKFPQMVPTEYAKKVKSVKEILQDKDVKSYELYTFVIREFDPTTGTFENRAYDIFWDGDLAEFDDTQENLDKMLTKSEYGFDEFVDFMERNKFLPDVMLQKFREDKNTHMFNVNGIYRVDIRNVLVIDAKLLPQV